MYSKQCRNYIFLVPCLFKVCPVFIYTTVVEKCPVQHDNTRLHAATFVQQYLQQMQYKIIPHPPLIPDFALCKFSLFTTFKEKLRGEKFNIESEVIFVMQGSSKQVPGKVFPTYFET